VQTAGGTVTLDTTTALSQPRSLFANAPAATSTQVQAAMYGPLGPAPTTSAKLSLDFDLTPGDTDTAFGGLIANVGTNVYLLVGPSGLCLQEGAYSTAPTYPRHPCHAVDFSKGWTHVDITLKRAGGGSVTTSLAIDGTAVETDYACDARFSLQALTVGVGYIYLGAPAAARMAHIDNIVAYDQ
jgi:hypothetical protein